MVSVEMAENSPSPQETPAPAPTPQTVGREFVRQYYTLLAEAPHFVHRFYSNESIFVHGDEDEVVGQENISKKIAQLGFNNCRTRILVLDSHQTLGKGIVVQVSPILFHLLFTIIRSGFLGARGNCGEQRRQRDASLRSDIRLGAAIGEEILRSQRHLSLRRRIQGGRGRKGQGLGKRYGLISFIFL